MLTKHIVSPIIVSAKAHKMQKHKKRKMKTVTEDMLRCSPVRPCSGQLKQAGENKMMESKGAY